LFIIFILQWICSFICKNPNLMIWIDLLSRIENFRSICCQSQLSPAYNPLRKRLQCYHVLLWLWLIVVWLSYTESLGIFCCWLFWPAVRYLDPGLWCGLDLRGHNVG
jgi:hypothetical protein